MIGVLCVAMLAGCGAYRMTPVAPQAVGDLKPELEDVDAGLVGLRPGFTPRAYSVIVITPFTVSESEINNAEDAELVKDMPAYFHAQLVRRLQASGVFATVIDAARSTPPLADDKTLRLEGDMTRLTGGNRLARHFIGLGVGAAKAQVETRLVGVQSGRVELVTADRRAAGGGLLGGDSRQFVTESMDQMAEAHVKLLRRLADGDRPGPK